MPIEALFDWISTYGYAALYLLLLAGIVGLPIPDETLLVFCGYLVSSGRLQPVPTLAVAFLGSASGITTSYTLGRTLGLGLIHRYGSYVHITEKGWKRVHDWFIRFGRWTLVVGYFVPGVRHLTALVAGATYLPVVSFARFAFPGALLWVSTFLTIGFFLGENWKQISGLLDRGLLFAAALAGAAVLIYLLIRKLRAGTRRT